MSYSLKLDERGPLMRRAGIVIVVMAALGLALAAPAFAQYPVPNPEISCLSITQAGATVGVDGTFWLPNSTVVLTFTSDPVVVGTPQTDGEGSFSTTVTIPSDATAGDHTITGTGLDQNGEPAQASCPIEVTGAGAPGEIPVTGTNVSLGLVILGAMILAGLGLLVMGRRKKADVHQ
jgi:LPXTG-motif cell wall-anchored protein